MKEEDFIKVQDFVWKMEGFIARGDFDSFSAYLQSETKSIHIPMDDLGDLLVSAGQSDREDMMIELLKKGVSLNYMFSSGTSLIVFAARYGLEKVVRYLLEAGVDPDDDTDADGMTPLAAAIWDKNYKIAKILIEKGADIDKRGMSILPRKIISQYNLWSELGLDAP